MPTEAPTPPAADLSVTLGRLELRNPVLVASGTFGYAKEMAPFVDFARLRRRHTEDRDAVAAEAGNKPPRTVEDRLRDAQAPSASTTTASNTS